MLGILESLEQKIHTYKISHPHLLLYILLLSVRGLCSSPVVETLNIMAYSDLIAIYCLTGCHAAAEEMYHLLHSPQNEWGDGLGVSQEPLGVTNRRNSGPLQSTRARPRDQSVPSLWARRLPVPRAGSLNAPPSPEKTAPSSTYRSLPKSHACPRSGHHQHRPCSPGTEREISWLVVTDAIC